MIPLLSLERQMLMVNEKIYKNYQKNVKILYWKDYMFLLGLMYFISHDGFQNMFVYQPTFSMMKYKNTNTEYIISWKSKGVNNYKHLISNIDFLLNIKCFNKK